MLSLVAGCASGDGESASLADEPVAAAIDGPAVAEASASDPASDAAVGVELGAEPMVAEPTTPEPVSEAVPEPVPQPVPAVTDELAAFGEVNAELLGEWGGVLESFGAEAMTYLADVSEAPSADAAFDLSTQVIEAVGPDTTDAGMIMIRDFAGGMAEALDLSKSGDQDGALTTFIELQSQSETFVALVDQMSA